MSDCHSSVLDLLTENIQLNLPEDVEILESSDLIHKHFQLEKMEIAIMNLPWEDAQENKGKIKEVCSPDFVIAADLVYDDSLFDNLLSCLDVIFEITDYKCEAIFFCTIRNLETFNIFTAKLSKLLFILIFFIKRLIEICYFALEIHNYVFENFGEFVPEILKSDDDLPKTVLLKIIKYTDQQTINN